jgi:hypothetical protein
VTVLSGDGMFSGFPVSLPAEKISSRAGNGPDIGCGGAEDQMKSLSATTG